VALTAEEADIGKRIRGIRKGHRISQRLAAAQMGLSRQQLDRIERGEVAVRFLPALRFCEFTDTNPLWLAFGEPEVPFRFFWLEYDVTCERGYRPLLNITGIAASQIPSDAIFLEVMQRHKKDYQAAAVYQATSDEIPLSVGLRVFWDNVRQQLTHERGFGKVGSMKLQKVSFWSALRERIRKLVRQRGMKSALARDIGVSRQAINSLLSKKRPYVPSAEYALRLSKWVEIAEAQQKQSARGSEAPARKTRRKSYYEKPSDRKRK
jgi:transcriptional regulator with XRE-family HTH domain